MNNKLDKNVCKRSLSSDHSEVLVVYGYDLWSLIG